MKPSPKSELHKYAKLTFQDDKTGERAEYQLSVATLMEMHVNLSDDETTNFVDWILQRIKAK